MVNHVAMIVPLVLYFALIMGIAWLGNRFAAKRADTAGFMEEYFIGSRSMGGFVLAMAVITTYTSASSFVGGPGIAYNLGLGWILLSMIQVPTAFLTLGVLGKRFARRAGQALRAHRAPHEGRDDYGFYTRALRQRRGRDTFVGGASRLLHGLDARAVHRRRAAL